MAGSPARYMLNGSIVDKLIRGFIAPPPFLDQSTPFSKIPSFPEIQDVTTFSNPIGKKKALKNPFNRVVYNSYTQSILNLEEYLQKW